MRAVERSIAILKTFSAERTELSLAEIAQSVDLAKATVSRLLKTMQTAGFIRTTGPGKFALGYELFILGNAAVASTGLVHITRPLMEEINQKTGEMVDLNVLVDGKRVCIAKIESKHELRHFVPIGKPLPAYRGASGKVLLAFSDENIVREVIEKASRDEAELNVPDIDVFLAEMAEIRSRGWAVTHGDRISGASSVSAPILDSAGKAIASLSIGGPTIRFTEGKVREFVDLVTVAARQASKAASISGVY